MIEYGQAFYGSEEIGKLIGGQSGKWQFKGTGEWLSGSITFKNPATLYKLPKDHWFYDSDEFERARKPSYEIAKPLNDYSDDELQDKIKSMQAEIDRRKAQDDEITILARKICQENDDYTNTHWINGYLDDTSQLIRVKAAIIAGMELQKGREA